ncbi:MAG TPA: alpha/beta fold hydrolase [Bryobacteraceae bacterium]|nr:alpha/beta fold hydrolase [Bryobacteraceae bacterium]
MALAGVAWAQSSMEGNWQGTLDAGAMKLRLGLHVSKSDAGWKSTFDSIDQGAMGLPVAVTSVSGPSLHFEMPAIQATFDGKLSADGKEIAGTFTQGVPLPLTFKRMDTVEAVQRPQTPKAPFPYDAIDVSYENKLGKLAGTLTIPRGAGPFPAALMITGSGPQNRDEELFGHKPFWVIADYLSRRGIAVLRVDDRGVGGSAGKSSQETLDAMVADVLSGIEFLKSRKDINAKKIGVIGHSEGGTVGPLAASRSGDIAFVVMMAGTGVTGEQVMYRQAELVGKSMGVGETAIARNRAVQEMIFRAVRQETDEKAAVGKFHAEWRKENSADPPESLVSQVKVMTSPEMHSFAFYDPAESLRKVKVPVLAMNGSRDVQVAPSQNLPAIKAALEAAGNKDFQTVELPGLNHLFQTCQKCTLAEYSAIEETISPQALDLMGKWLTQHTLR